MSKAGKGKKKKCLEMNSKASYMMEKQETSKDHQSRVNRRIIGDRKSIQLMRNFISQLGFRTAENLKEYRSV